MDGTAMVTEAARDQWKAALPSEVEFWRQVISGERPEKEWTENMCRRVAGAHQFPTQLTPYLRSGTTRILDVGAGPVTCIGPVGAPSPVEIVAVDPLADAYNRLLTQHGMTPVTRTIWAEGEDLASRWRGQFDIVYSRNALDHAYDPVRVIREMVAACKPSGVVFFEGYVNESVTANAAGLHQWNFMPVDNGDLVVWDPENKARSLRNALRNAEVIAAGNKWYTVEIRPDAEAVAEVLRRIRRWPPWLRPLVRRLTMQHP